MVVRKPPPKGKPAQVKPPKGSVSARKPKPAAPPPTQPEPPPPVAARARGRGKPPHVVTENSQKMVEHMTAYGMDQGAIACLLEISEPTLRKHYRKQIDMGLPIANATIGDALYKKAKNGDTIAMIFWLKTRAGWSEKLLVQDVTPEVDLATLSDAAIAERIARLRRSAVARSATANKADGAVH